MTANKIHILSAPKHSGKTTQLARWAGARHDVFGILTPIVNGKRVFMDAHTKEQFHMEATEDEIDILEIGKYRFSKKSFDKAIGILLEALNEKTGFIIVDEIGPLELRGFGFSEVLQTLLDKANSPMQIVLVMREALLEDVADHFQLNRFTVTPMNF